MSDYKEMYFKLAGKVADAVELLVTAQQEAEEVYINASDGVDEETEGQAVVSANE